MHWVGGGGFKSTKGQYPPCKDRTYLCEGRRFFFRVLSCIAKKANDMYACFGVKTVIVTNKVSLN